MERNSVVRRRGSFMLQALGSQMELSLSALRAGQTIPHEDSWYSFLLEADSTTGP
jgi:hypothetical protein